jgi:hypothetical protein
MAKHRPKSSRKTQKNTKRKIEDPGTKPKDDIFGFFSGKIKIVGDIVAPAFTPEEWGDLYFGDDSKPKLDSSQHPRKKRS